MISTELVGCRGRHVRVTQTPKHAQVVIVGRDTEEHLVQRCNTSSFARPPVDEVCGRVQSLGPEQEGNLRMKKHCPHTVVKGPQRVLCLPILRRDVGGCHERQRKSTARHCQTPGRYQFAEQDQEAEIECARKSERQSEWARRQTFGVMEMSRRNE